LLLDTGATRRRRRRSYWNGSVGTRGSLESFWSIFLVGCTLHGSCKLSRKHMNETILQIFLVAIVD
jgi:hypothetical protein